MIAMGPLGETTPKPLRCSIISQGPAAWVMPRIVGHDTEDDFVLRQAHDNVGIWILEDAVKRSPHNVHYWAALIDALDQEEQHQFYDTIRPSRFAERASRDALKLNPGDPLLLVARARLLEPWAALKVLDELEKAPGHAREAQRLKEILRLGFPIPDDREDLMTAQRATKLIRLDRTPGPWRSWTRAGRPRPRTINSWRSGPWPWPCKASSIRPWNSRRRAGISNWRSTAAITGSAIAC